MRTTVDLPPAAHRRVQELAASRHQSMSAVIAELTIRGLAQTGAHTVLTTDDRSGFPVISVGRPVTSDEVAAVLDDQ